MRLAAALLCATALACTTGPTSPQADCFAALMFDGALYTPDGPLTQDSFVPGEVVGEVRHDLGCNDQPEPGAEPEPEMQDGDSNFLPIGTKIYSVEGVPTAERLAVRPDTTWILLGPIE